jgi:SNF2 family DNA or RNA helicase
VVFSRYRRTLEFLEAQCRQHGISHALFHGALSREEKELALNCFRNEARLLLATEMGGEGHNLQFCHTLINFDLPWNPMKIEQRIGRLQRIGQTRDVFVFNFCQAATLEEYLLRVLDTKLNMFQMVIGEVESILGEWEEENEFAQLIVDLWVESETAADRDRQFDDLGERLLEAKSRYLESRELDSRLFDDA